MPLNHAERQAQAAIVTETQFLLDQKVAVILFAPEWHVLARRCIGQGLLPVDAQGELFQLFNLVIRGIEPADHSAHAGAGDGINADTLLLQRLEHTDVGQAACGAAREHEPDFRLRFFGGKQHQWAQAKQ